MFERFIDRNAARERISRLGLRSFFNARSIGYALQRAWVFLLFLGAAASNLTATGEPMPQEAFTLSSVMLCLVLFGSAMREDLFLRIVTGRFRRWLGPALTTLGTIAGFLIFAPGIPSGPMELLCGLLTGIGSGMIDLGYGLAYRNVEPWKTGLEIPFASVLAALIYTFGMVTSLAFMFFLAMLLPLASGYLYLHVLHIFEPGAEPEEPAVRINLPKYTWRIGACACLVGIADSVMRQLFMHLNGIPAQTFFQPGLLISSVIMAVILIGHQLFAKTVNYRSVYKFVVLVMAGSFMLLPVFIGAALAESIIGLVGYLSMNVLIWLMLAELCYTYRLSPVKVFGIGWGMITLGVLVGQLFAGWLVKTVTFTPQLVSLAVLICTLAVLVSEMFVLQEDDIIEMTKITEEAPAEPVRTPFKDRCREVAEEYGLTPRETEVMILFAKGRSSARIQEDLVLSRGTVTTHLQRIYQKMGVHSKQEFLDLIDNH